MLTILLAAALTAVLYAMTLPEEEALVVFVAKCHDDTHDSWRSVEKQLASGNPIRDLSGEVTPVDMVKQADAFQTIVGSGATIGSRHAVDDVVNLGATVRVRCRGEDDAEIELQTSEEACGPAEAMGAPLVGKDHGEDVKQKATRSAMIRLELQVKRVAARFVELPATRPETVVLPIRMALAKCVDVSGDFKLQPRYIPNVD